MPSIPVITPAEAGAWDARAERDGIALATLMESAGRAVVSVLAERWPDRAGQGVLVAAGPGNNGGDGWVVARVLHRLGVPVWVTSAPGPASELCANMSARARSDGVREVAPDGPWPTVAVIVDALLGTGAKGPPRPPMQALVDRIDELGLPVLAIDGPTGLDLLNGASHGQAIQAELTVTFGGVRRGHLLARDEIGDLVVTDIGHPNPDPAWSQLMTDDVAAGHVGRLASAAHKGERGRVVVVGGDPAMVGAVRFAARAAFGAGAGLVHAVAPAASVEALRTAEPDLQTMAHELEGAMATPLRDLLERADAVVVGPGLGRSPGRKKFVAEVLRCATKAVVDADALTLHGGDLAPLAEAAARIPLVLTPHGGEFRALFPALAGGQEVDPWSAASAASREVGATILLKGVPTIIGHGGQSPFTVAAGNPGLATGGSGDLLSGFTATMLAQGITPPLAAAIAAQMLGRAAEIGARRNTARALRPMNVLEALPDLWRGWEARRAARPPIHPPRLLELFRPEG